MSEENRLIFFLVTFHCLCTGAFFCYLYELNVAKFSPLLYILILYFYCFNQSNLIRVAASNYLLDSGVQWGGAPAMKVNELDEVKSLFISPSVATFVMSPYPIYLVFFLRTSYYCHAGYSRCNS